MPPPAADPKGTHWSLEDLVDFDYALEFEQRNGTLSHPTHRRIYRRLVAEGERSSPPSTEPTRARGFHHWLQHQRSRPLFGEHRPGKEVTQALAAFRVGLTTLAIILGTTTTATLLRYDGTQPTNLAGFLCLLLGGQILLVCITLSTILYRRFGLLQTREAPLHHSIQGLFQRTLEWIHRKREAQLPAESRLRLNAFFGTLTKHHGHYHPILIAHLGSTVQRFGVWFNLAALTTLCLLVTVSDRAFGWQSTLKISAHQVHQGTRLLSLPWSWILPNASPKLEEIEGSRIFLKDGIRTLAQRDLVAWWPFLIGALITYGLIPRSLLWLGYRHFLHRSLATLTFDSLSCDRLWESMRTEVLKTTADPLPPPAVPPSVAPPKHDPPPSNPTDSEPSDAVDRSAVVIIEPELAKRIDRARTDAALGDQIGWTISEWIHLPDELESWSEFWRRTQALRTQASFNRIILVQEAFQPPIREALEWIQEFRQAQPPSGKMMIFLVGRPREPGRRRDVCETNQRVWEQSIETLGDANLSVDKLEIEDAAQ